MILTNATLQQPTLQPSFVIPNLTPNTQPIPLENCKTKHFYYHLQHDQQTQPPALNHWRTLPNHPNFNHTFWKDTYPNLATNKVMLIGKLCIEFCLQPYPFTEQLSIIHQIVTAVIQQKTLNISFSIVLLLCPFGLLFKMTNNTLQLTDTLKLFGLSRTNNIIHDKDTLNLVNWTLTNAR